MIIEEYGEKYRVLERYPLDQEGRVRVLAVSLANNTFKVIELNRYTVKLVTEDDNGY